MLPKNRADVSETINYALGGMFTAFAICVVVKYVSWMVTP